MSYAPLKRLGMIVLFVFIGNILLLLVMSAVIMCGTDPVRQVTVPAYVILLLGAFLCGFWAAKGQEHPIWLGLSAMGMYLLPIFLISLCFQPLETAIWQRLLMYAVTAGVVMIGTFAGCYRRQRKISPTKSRELARKKLLMNKRP